MNSPLSLSLLVSRLPLELDGVFIGKEFCPGSLLVAAGRAKETFRRTVNYLLTATLSVSAKWYL